MDLPKKEYIISKYITSSCDVCPFKDKEGELWCHKYNDHIHQDKPEYCKIVKITIEEQMFYDVSKNYEKI